MIVGQAPAKGNEGLLPFAGRSGARLAKLAGVGESGDDLPDHFELRNLLDYYSGKDGAKGDKFDWREGIWRARELAHEVERGRNRVVLLMGHGVKKSFGFGNYQYLERIELGAATYIIFPHPSGVNMWYNSPAHCDQARLVLREVVSSARQGQSQG